METGHGMREPAMLSETCLTHTNTHPSQLCRGTEGPGVATQAECHSTTYMLCNLKWQLTVMTLGASINTYCSLFHLILTTTLYGW